MTRPKVSVCIICYNQASFIAQALDSALMQRTSFEYEIVVGDDCSPDETGQIIAGYRRRWPDRIRSLVREKNLGMNRNLRETMSACQGEYIALLEGDDFWTSPDKLQRQADFLDRNRDCALCHHRVAYIEAPEDRQFLEFPPRRFRRERQDPRVLSLYNYIQTCAVVFRKELLPVLDGVFEELKLGDWPLCVLLSQRGGIGYIDEVWASYRVHPNNSWNHRREDYKLRATEKMAVFLLERVKEQDRELWRDMLVALAFKDLFLAVRSLSPKAVLEKLRYFGAQSAKYNRPFWLVNRLWPYVRENCFNWK